jgi:ABC-type antimicrobial peptide transport system permease subunit
MALRNIGRTRGRTTTTLLALFVGVFTIGLILTLAQNLRDMIDKELAQVLTFNVAVTATGKDAQTLSAQSSSIPGIQHIEQHSYTTVLPVSINGKPLTSLLHPQQKINGQSGNNDLLYASVFLGSIEGYDVSHQQLPDTHSMILTGGRNLQASDVGTDNVLVSSLLNSITSLKGELKPGSTITLMSSNGRTTRQVHIVGFYQSTGSTYGQIFAVNDTVTALTSAGQGVTQNFYIKVDPNQVGNALNKISQLAPNAGVQNLADIGDFINSYINNTLLMLTALASLSLLAGVIIIANAVALAMLERRRELGILKSVGYTSSSILGEVLVENGIVGGTGALLAMLLVTLITSLLGTFLFKTTFGVSWYIAIGLIGGVALLAIITALLVAWNAVRIRPLEVLRYE